MSETVDLFSIMGVEAPAEKEKPQKAVVNTENNTSKSNLSKTTTVSPVKEIEQYTGEIIIKAYGNEYFRVPGPIKEDYLLSDVLEKIREEYGLREFNKNRTIYSFDKETGILCFDIKFQKKG